MKQIAPFADIAVALKLEANHLAERAEDAEMTAASIGLSRAVADHLVAERRRQAELVADAYHLIRALMPVEQTVRAVATQSGETF